MRIRSLFTAGAAALVTLATLGVAAPGYGASPTPDPNERRLIAEAEDEGSVRVIVKVDELGAKQRVLDNIDEGTTEINRSYRSFPLLALDADKEALEELAADPDVVAIEEDKVGGPSLASSIPFIRADRVHTLGFDGDNQAVAILDTGIDVDHPYFAGRIVSEACYSSVSDAANQASLCPDGTASQTGTGSADAETAQCLNGTANICTHGSHVAGIAAGSTAAATGDPGNGVAPDADIIAIQIYHRQNTGCDGAPPCVRFFYSDFIAGMQRVYDLRNTFTIAAANLSGGDDSNQSTACDTSTTKASIDLLLSAGITTTISAMNEGHPAGVGEPACVSTAVAVGAIDADASGNDVDTPAGYSNRGAMLDLFAPGTSVVSSIPDDTYASFQGTSMAAPHVAGALAGLRQAYPAATAATLLGYLRDTGVDITYASGGTNVTTPRIDLLAALQEGNNPPSVGADQPTVAVNEGTAAANAGSFGDPEGRPVTLSASSGTVTTTGPGRWSWTFGTNDGPTQSRTVTITATDDKGETATTTFALTVANVAPAVTVDPAQVTTIAEGATLTTKASFVDPGWGDTYSSQVDWGFDAPSAGSLLLTNDGAPADRGDVTGSRAYGDNGSFTVGTTVTDDDGGVGTASFPLQVTNVAPTAAIDETGVPVVNGVPTYVAHRGQPVSFKGRSTDPGSDDLALTWNWGDGSTGTTTGYLVNPPGTDPANSPSVQPRDVSDSKSHVFGSACSYQVGFASRDDDGGTSADTARVIVTGNSHLTRIAPLWFLQTRPGPRVPPLDLPVSTLNCYLQVAQHMSPVFSEATDVSTIAKAHAVLNIQLLNPKREFDRQALAAWLNFADGSFDLGTRVDTNLDLRPDSTFGAVMAKAESLRLNPATTSAQLRAQTLLLEKLNLLGK
ncbi:S8 family serine peptidase [Kribbella sp. CA-247076]|uniref:S8 family peptidase n=1 Tax=Kribbella sp. CA-247076 TaxID=3239941 RepID=UPI003D90A33C